MIMRFEIETKAKNFQAILLEVLGKEFGWWIHTFRQENPRTDKVRFRTSCFDFI